jgi:L-ascorbate metabolism protein UlaG (beta-lactamase superfamily)
MPTAARSNSQMHRRSFLQSSAVAGIGLAVTYGTGALDAAQSNTTVRVRLIRHATCVVHYGPRTLLVDPMLGDPGVMPPIARSPNPRPNPLVPLPVPAAGVLDGVEAILVTHTHSDHWDAAATALVPKDAVVLIQPPDAARFANWGFSGAQPVTDSVSWQDVRISRTGGQHGRGAVGERLAPVSGFVLSGSGQPTLYVAGDTVWCPDVAAAIESHKPDIIIVNAGAAQFLEGGVITMDVDDVVEVCRAAPRARVIAVHMEAINHCVLTRNALRAGLEKAAVKTPVLIPADGEELRLG